MQHSDTFDNQADDQANINQVTLDSNQQHSDEIESQQPQMFVAETHEQADVVHADIENHLVLEIPTIEILTDANTPAEDQGEVTANGEATSEENGFADLGLSHALLKSLSDSGYTQPTPIQAQAIPPAMAGRDLLLSAQTGSGKTAAFVLPILDLIAQSQSKSRATRALILTPTRELAQQVSDSIRRYGSHMRDLYCIPLVGGAPYTGQIRALKKGVQIIIATPGRLLDHMSDGRIDLSNLSVLVLDEADRMLDMGFSEDINRILQQTPAERQTIMSSATWDGPVGKIAASFTKNPERIAIKVESAHIDEKVYFCDDFNHKNKLLESLVCDKDLQQAIIFTATKRSSEQVAERLQEQGHKACFLHGDLPQSKRNRILADVKAGKFDIIVATDVAARGIDVPAISHVFNYDLPRQVEDYVHRIGRCGRAGRTGVAINLCSRDDRSQFSQINRYLKREMTEATVEGLEPRFIEKNYESRGAGRGRSNSNNRGGSRSGGYSNGGRSSDSRGSSRPSSSYAGNRDSSSRDSSSRDGASRPSFSRGDSRPSDNRGSSERQDRFGGERRSNYSTSNSNGSNSNGGGYRGERSDSRPSNAGSNGQNNNGKMLTSHEFNFANKLGAGRGDRPERSDRNDRNDRGDRPQQGRSDGGRSEGGRSQYAKPAFNGDRSSDRNSDNRSNDRGFDRNNDRNSDRRSAPRDDRSGRPSFDRPMSKNSQGYQDRKRQTGSSDRPHDGERRSSNSGFGRPASSRPQHSGSGESFARRPRPEEGSDSRRDGDKPARRQSSFEGRSDRRDSTGKPV